MYANPIPTSARHLAAHSAQSSSSSSPAGTPPAAPASNAASTSSLQQQATQVGTMGSLPSPNPGQSAQAQAPATTPGGTATSSTNRFGLALNFIQRRPRGLTNPSSMTAGGGGRSPGSPPNELPPSPSGGERSGYGFPALRRTLSKRANSSGQQQAGEGSSSSTSRIRGRSRSTSQPPTPAVTDATADRASRPRTATLDSTARGAQAASSAVGSTSSLPNASSSSEAIPVGGAADAQAGAAVASDTTYRLRLVPHLESSRSLHFEPVDRDLTPFRVVKVGRFTDRAHQNSAADPTRVAFKSKVVSRGHAEIWADEAGKFFIKDTKSSSGTFLNHIRLSAPNVESRAFPLKDGDVLQLGVDYQGGTEEIYRCVKMRVELNRAWQRGNNAFNTAALAQLRALGGTTPGGEGSAVLPLEGLKKAPAAPAGAASITDCCICLYPVTVCQALFIAPCSHVTHYKCIRPLVMQNYPGFCCPLCRTYADLEADVEIEPAEADAPEAAVATVDEEPEREAAAAEDEPMSSVEEADEPPSAAASRAASIRSRPASVRNAGDNASVSRVAMSGLGRSRPASLINEPSSSPSSAPVDFVPPLPTESEIYASLASAATPPNSTFLSTLADGRLPRMSGPPASQHVSLDHALLAHAGPSATSFAAAAQPPPTQLADRLSFGSNDETDGSKEEEDGTGHDRQSAVSVSVAMGSGGDKGKRRAVDEDKMDIGVDGNAVGSNVSAIKNTTLSKSAAAGADDQMQVDHRDDESQSEVADGMEGVASG